MLVRQIEGDLLITHEGFANEEYSFTCSIARWSFSCVEFPVRGERNGASGNVAVRGDRGQ